MQQTFELLLREAALQRGLHFQEIVGPMAEDIQIFSGMVGSGSAFILTELHIQNPMEFIAMPQ